MVEDSTNSLMNSDLKWNGWRQAEKTITFIGATTNAIGDYDGTGDPFDIFTVTGEVLIKMIAVCTTGLAGASAVIRVGADVSGQYAEIIAQTTATDIIAGELWHDVSPDKSIEASTVMAEKILVNGTDIVGEVDTANITSGVLKFICLWKPLSVNGKLVAA